MTISKAKNIDIEKLVEDIPLSSLDVTVPKIPPTKKRAYRIRRIAEPHIRGHKVKGRTYYTYCRGTDQEIYLGSANAILKAVHNAKQKE